MTFHFSTVRSHANKRKAFLRMRTEGLLPTAMSSQKDPSLHAWLTLIDSPRHMLVRCDGISLKDTTAYALFSPFRGYVWEFDFTTFRAHTQYAIPMAQQLLHWLFEHSPCEGIVGICPYPNRHAWRLAQHCGFTHIARLPSACWWASRQRHVDGILVMATLQTLTNNLKGDSMGFGGNTPSYDPPVVLPTPKQQVTKPVTAAASAARQQQKEKSTKAAGIQASILTSPLNESSTNTKTLLGQ